MCLCSVSQRAQGQGGQREQANAEHGGAVGEDGRQRGACVDFNAENDLPHAPGNPVIAYACGSPPAWNEQWTVEAATGLVRATFAKGGGASNLCIAAPPAANGWTLPWLDAWSLKDY